MIKWAVGGFNLLEQGFIDFRHTLCESCQYKTQSRFRTYCALCACTLNKRRNPFNKLAHHDEECPIHRWRMIPRGKK
jgi:hypothetical protein